MARTEERDSAGLCLLILVLLYLLGQSGTCNVQRVETAQVQR